MSNVLFVCLQNAGRSQISEALFTRAVGGTEHRARSAGTTPANQVHPEVITVMDEWGIDLRDRVPQRLTQELAEWADVVVTMGCGDACPYVPGVRYLDWKLEDPSGQGVDQVRRIRDEIEQRVRGLVVDPSDHDGRRAPRRG